MELGKRHIRSSGRGSGSIEITLPSRLRALSGLPCRVSWSDRPTPHIVLEPDLAPSLAVLGRVWERLLPALGLPPAPPPPLTITLDGGTAGGLLWDDALALSGPGLHEAAAVSRIIAALTAVAQPEAPVGFAAVLGFLATGAVPDARHRDDCAIAAAAFPTRAAAALDGLGDALWQALPRQAIPLMALCQALAADPDRHEALRTVIRTDARVNLGGLLP